MRYSIGAKFLAVMLCAAALLGILASTGGIVLLMGTGLYSKTPEAYREERIRQIGESLAQGMAQRYCSEHLGSVQEDVAEKYLGAGFYGGFDRRYTYMELKNADGEVLCDKWSQSVKNSATAQVYSFPVTGEYMNLLSMEPVAEPTLEPEQGSQPTEAEEYAYYGEIGDIPTQIYRVSLDNGESGSSFAGEFPVGILYRVEDGLVYEHFDEETMVEQEGGRIYTIDLQDQYGNSVVFAYSSAGVGELEPVGRGRFRIRLYDLETLKSSAAGEQKQGSPEGKTVRSAASTAEEEWTQATDPAETVPEEPIIGGKPLSEYQIMSVCYSDGDQTYDVEYIWLPIEGMTATIYAEPGAVVYDGFLQLSSMIYPYRNGLFVSLAISTLLCAVFTVYLCCAAGRRPKSDEICAGGLNRISLDAYLAIVVLGCDGIAFLTLEGGDFFLRQSVRVGTQYVVAACYAASLLVVSFGFAFVAQVKTANGYWWRNSLCCRSLVLMKRILLWIFRTGVRCVTSFFPLLGRLLKALGGWTAAAGKGLWSIAVRCAKGISGWCRRWMHRALCLLPLTWQWLLGGVVLTILLLAAVVSGSEGISVLCLVGGAGLILYGANCFGTLMDSTQRMSKGDLAVKVNSDKMVGEFKTFAGNLNALADVAVVAAQKQLKSERMKTELITNVSHDIKTPLTSIINYVDLLQKPHSQEEQEQYLEVLSRQSQRLKKLIEDLMDMSKASTGNMTVELQSLDAAEFINQALGEFSDKLERAQLIPVFRRGEEEIRIRADGRLVWRVLSNLLSNAVKYAMPGTRLYIDLGRVEGKVLISLKNISREELNLDADELVERFVRGDGSRNTEGSGLGLNIAKSLMELQKGQLQLLVDGDLFKVTLIFPEAI